MLSNLVFTNLHFTIKLLAALVFFFTAWLHIDSWKVERKTSILMHALGFLLLSIASIVFATNISSPAPSYIVQVLKVIALVFIIIGTYSAPKLSFPDIKNLAVFPITIVSLALTPVVAALYMVASLSFFKRVKLDKDRQLSKVAYAFLLFAIAETVNIAFVWAGTGNVFWSRALANLGFFWILTRSIQLLGVVILGIWAWGYIRFRPQVQLFATFTAASLGIFLTTTVLFTALLLNNLETQTLSRLETDVKVLDLRISSLKFESLANAKAITGNHNLETYVSENDIKSLDQFAMDETDALNIDFLDIISQNGSILSRATDVQDRNESFIGNPLFSAALDGNSNTGVVIENSVLAPKIYVDAFSPINVEDNGKVKIAGAVSTGIILDSAFVDFVKNTTGLDAAVYANDQVVATTFLNSNGERNIGLKLTDTNITSKVVGQGQIYTGKINYLNEPYYATFAPLNDFNNKPVGMLFIGFPQRSLLSTASKSIQLTFIGSAILIVISTIPAFILSKYIKKNLNA